MIEIYRKTTNIKAEQFNESDEMIDKYNIKVLVGDYAEDYSIPEAGPAPYFRYFMPSGYNEVCVGDWIATGVKGKNWAISNDVFKQTYAELPTLPKAVADWIEKCKHDKIALGGAMDEDVLPEKVADYFREYHTREKWIKLQNDFARAWLDGYQTEE